MFGMPGVGNMGSIPPPMGNMPNMPNMPNMSNIPNMPPSMPVGNVPPMGSNWKPSNKIDDYIKSKARHELR